MVCVFHGIGVALYYHGKYMYVVLSNLLPSVPTCCVYVCWILPFYPSSTACLTLYKHEQQDSEIIKPNIYHSR